jgi:hypothetical protein
VSVERLIGRVLGWRGVHHVGLLLRVRVAVE